LYFSSQLFYNSNLADGAVTANVGSMKVKSLVVVVVACAAILAGYAACLKFAHRTRIVRDPGKENIASFAKQSLDLDLKTIELGQRFATAETAAVKATFADTANGVTWYTTPESAKYREAHPNRALSFGVRNGHLVAIMVRVDLDTIRNSALVVQPVVLQTTNVQWTGMS